MILKNKMSVVKKGLKGSVEYLKKWSVIKGLKPHSVSLGKQLNHNYHSSLI